MVCLTGLLHSTYIIFLPVKQFTCGETDSVALSFCCSMRHTIEDVLLGQRFALHREIQSPNRGPGQYSGVCCAKFKRVADNGTVTTPLMPFLNSSISWTIPEPPDLSRILYDITKLTGWEKACILYSQEYCKIHVLLCCLFIYLIVV